MRTAVIAATALSLALAGGAFAQPGKTKPRRTADTGGAARTVETPSATPAAEGGPPTRGAARFGAPSATTTTITAATPSAATPAAPTPSTSTRGTDAGAPGTDAGKGVPGGGGSPPPTLPSTGDASATPPPGSKTPPAA